MIRFATNQDYEQLKDIWRVCFGDDEAYINLFFQTRYQPNQTLIYQTDGQVVAMLHLLPMALQIKEQRYTGKYIYAVATLEEYRGKGISTRLLSFADDYLQKNQIDCAVLVPATQKLFSFYQQKGYVAFSDIGKISINPSTLLHSDVVLTSNIAKLSELEQMRASFFGANNAFIAWNKDTLAYLEAEIALTGGQAIALSDGCGGMAYAVCYAQNQILTIKEIATNHLEIEDVIFHLYQKFSLEYCDIQIKTDFFTRYPKKILPFSLIKWYNNKIVDQAYKTAPYMGLVSD